MSNAPFNCGFASAINIIMRSLLDNKIESLEQSTVTANMKNAKRAFKMVPSTFEPPEETEASYQYFDNARSEISGRPKFPNYLRDSPIPNDSAVQFYAQRQHSNVEFIKSLVPMKQAYTFEEGDCLPLDSDDRWVITAGNVRIVGVNDLSFTRGEGCILFVSPQTKTKIKQVVSISLTTAYRIPHLLFKQHIRHYLYVKNAEKIKFLRYCPFLAWNQSVAEDIAVNMEVVDLEKDTQIYNCNSEADFLYFVKEGIVLLERLGKVGNQVIKDYQRHYESSQLSEEEGLLIVRKGMIFGVDGILIKERASSQMNNPEDSNSFQPYDAGLELALKSTRIYTAKAIGKAEVFRLEKVVLETYLKKSEHLKDELQDKMLSHQELDRICLQYTNLLMGSEKMTKSLKKKDFVFNCKAKDEAIEEMNRKRRKVQEIKEREKKLKKHMKEPQLKNRESPHLFSNKKSPKKQSLENLNRTKNISLPSLCKNNVESLIMRKLETKEALKYMSYKKKIESELQPPQNLQFMKVKSYRSLLSSLSGSLNSNS